MNLVFENISKVFQDTVALEKINLTMSSGVYGLLGPNGAGKTTMMKIMTDLVPPSTGRGAFGRPGYCRNGSRFPKEVGVSPPGFWCLPELYCGAIFALHCTIEGPFKV